MEASAPLVTAIIPTYNWSSVLRHAIGSVLWQSLQDFELLVSGDGCTDDSEEVVASFGDPRIRWLNLPENSGNQPAPINAALEIARGRYIAYLGHDDLWLPDHLERMSDALERSGADFTYAWVQLIGPDPDPVRVLCGITASGEYEFGTSLVPTGVMHRRDIFADIGGPWRDFRSSTVPPDQELVERAVLHGKKFVPSRRLTALKFTATWRPNCYVDKPCHQQAEYSRRIQENPHFAADELHDLLEYYIRKHPEDIAHNNVAENSRPGQLIEGARRLRGLKPITLPPAPAPASYSPLTGRIDLALGESGRWLGPGWSGQEAGFRWTDGHESQLIFALETPGALVLRIHCAALIIQGKVESQPVKVLCNGTEAGAWDLTQWEMTTHEMPIEGELLRHENIITFHLPNATSPISAIEGSTDFRYLGLRVAWIELDPAPLT